MIMTTITIMGTIPTIVMRMMPIMSTGTIVTMSTRTGTTSMRMCCCSLCCTGMGILMSMGIMSVGILMSMSMLTGTGTGVRTSDSLVVSWSEVLGRGACCSWMRPAGWRAT